VKNQSQKQITIKCILHTPNMLMSSTAYGMFINVQLQNRWYTILASYQSMTKESSKGKVYIAASSALNYYVNVLTMIVSDLAKVGTYDSSQMELPSSLYIVHELLYKRKAIINFMHNCM